ncbi:hypothetical protein D0C36_17370 [Mucilaginibacter conchicola]|uniref:Uncharacterized protein n=1 Tax=Mucilaginibacter conchicola TaxID=2303333 RepID=A0A372NP71_9SPHI|nr:hypothetical protein [Mucilaginibacter conchicola]RFZ90731.1 hypothetical protein D0C36_17370 [Mucilaginibacter conchicola]
MERRSFIRLSAFTAAALTLPMMQSCNTLSEEDALSKPDLLMQLVDEKEIKAVGTAYRQQVKTEADQQKLRMLLLNGKPDNTDSVELKRALDKQVSADFAAGKIVQLNGWILSVTEARQCALYSLLKA